MISSWFALKLTVGNFALSDDQERLQMAMWSMLAAPLLMSTDLRTIRRSSKAILLNRNIIAINQDPLGKQGQKILQVTNELLSLYINICDTRFGRGSLECYDTIAMIIIAFV